MYIYIRIFGFVPVLLLQIAAHQPAEIHEQIARAAAQQVGIMTEYTPKYIRLKYPGGDLPPEQGVCADVIIRAFRKIGIDLQKEIHEDMRTHFKRYPNLWGMNRPDPNIDHRRVPNLMKYFLRKGKSAGLHSEYIPGDIVAWQLDHGLFHIGIVSLDTVPSENRYYIIHNIGAGARKEDVLNEFQIIGHYRW